MPAFFALTDPEIGILGIGRTEQEAIENYAGYLMAEGSDCDTIEEQIELIELGDYTMRECSEAVYNDFLHCGNQGSYDVDEDGILILWPEEDD